MAFAIVLALVTFFSGDFSLSGLLGASTSPESLHLSVLDILPLLAIFLATWVARRVLDHRSMVSLGFRLDHSTVPDLLFGFIVPGFLFGLIFLFERGMGWMTYSGTAFRSESPAAVVSAMAGGLVLFVLVGFQEELLSRGYQLQNLVEGLNLPWALIISSAIFGLLHIANPSAGWASLVGILVAGLFLAFAWIRTGQLWLPIGLHIGWNFFEGTVFGFPVSGTGGYNLVLQSVRGPEWLTGGGFGPEAGLVVIPALALGAVLIWLYTRTRAVQMPPIPQPLR